MFINYLLRFFQIFAMGEGVIPPHGSLAQRQSAESRPLLRLEGAGSSPARPVFCTLIIEYWWLECYNIPEVKKLYNDIISALASCFNVFGTVFAVLCIIKMSFKDVMRTREVWRLDHEELDVLEQRYYARAGIGIIIIGFILQLFTTFLKSMSVVYCLILSGTATIMAFVIVLIERYKMKRDKKRAKKENP